MGFFDNLFGRNNPKPSTQPTFSPSATGPFVFPGLDENFQPIYPTIHEFGPDIPNYSTYSDQQLAECFLPQRWSAEDFGDRQKEALLQEVNNRFATAHHLSAIPVRVRSEMSPQDMGAYDPASRSIDLNPKYLDNPFEALDSVTHESQHYVDDMNVRKGTGDTPENLAVYACENSSGGYGQPPKGNEETNPVWQATYNYYNAQALEAHANNAGFAAVASHHDLYKDCPEYSKYLDGRAEYFGNVKGSLTADPEKWNALEQAHIRSATGQTPETIKMACAERQRGTDAQQKAILNADAVKVLQHDCARQQSAAPSQSGTSHNQNAAAISPGQDNSLHRIDSPESASQKSTSEDGEDGNERMRRAPEADKSDTPANTEEQNTENSEAPEIEPPQQPAAENQAESSENSENRTASQEEAQTPHTDGEAPEDGEEAAPAREQPAPETEGNEEAAEEPRNPNNSEEQPTEQVSGEECETPHTEDEAPGNGEDEAHDREAPTPDEEESEGIQNHPQEDDHGPNDGPGQTAAEDGEGIRKPEQENVPVNEEADGIREEPSAPRDNATDEEEGIRDHPQEESPQKENNGIRNEPEAADSAQQDQAEGISGKDTAPAPSERAEETMGQ